MSQVIKVDIEKVISSKSAKVAKYAPKFLINWMKRLIHQDEINEALELCRGMEGRDFAKGALEYLNVKCNVTYTDKSALKQDERYIFVSNHPLGGLDGLILISELGEVMGNILFVVNDFLMHIKPLEPIFVPINKVGRMGKAYSERYEAAYSSDSQILYFPAGLCSRLIDGKITDLDWKTSYIKQARRYGRKIVPVYFSGQNSKFFYRLAKIRKMLGIKFNIEMCFLPDEMFKQKNANFDVIIGTPIEVPQYANVKDLEAINTSIRAKAYALKNEI
ncbi:MAG: 1-acyl-sn-glycerol-3-phosphate acyltransferase [Bacteroidales bacterium]|nr:1-acyl-sn-glycerol-3-phosphate acyltransferase [Bacteroidales bacterium]